MSILRSDKKWLFTLNYEAADLFSFLLNIHFGVAKLVHLKVGFSDVTNCARCSDCPSHSLKWKERKTKTIIERKDKFIDTPSRNRNWSVKHGQGAWLSPGCCCRWSENWQSLVFALFWEGSNGCVIWSKELWPGLAERNPTENNRPRWRVGHGLFCLS